MPSPKDFTGSKYGRLTALRIGPLINGDRHWTWLCDCGQEKDASVKNVRYGKIISCGCAKLARITRHGRSKTRTYRIWALMKHRATYSDHPSYQHVSMHSRWENFENFIIDMGECPEGLTIDRIKNSKGYEPGNCRWATRLDQVINRDCVILVEVDGRKINLREACRILGRPYSTVHYRVKHLGMPPHEAIRAPKWLRSS